MEILLRLPVGSVLRFRSVSKSWRGIIDCPEFIRRHSERWGSGKSDSRIIIAGSSNLYTIQDLDSRDGAKAKMMNSPLKNGSCFKVSSARGVVCLGYPSGPREKAKCFMLWNPATSKGDHPSRVVDCSSVEHLKGKFNSVLVDYTFGYDHIKNDHILARTISEGFTETFDLEILRNSGEVYGFQLEIYSFRSDSWKTIMKYKDGRFPYYCILFCMVVFVDGVNAMHFVVAENKASLEEDLASIARFDLGTESFSLVPMPEWGRWNITWLTCLDGCLCSCRDVFTEYGASSTTVWVMKDYGIRESWVKLVSIVHTNLISDVLPIGYSQSGGKLILATRVISRDEPYLLCYDVENKSLERVAISGLPPLQGRFVGCVCSPSLVSI